MTTPAIEQERRSCARRAALALGLSCISIYALFNYGGLRSPDEEVVFRVAEALAQRGSFAVEQALEWESFGLPFGVDGRRYSILGPAQSLAAAPLVWSAGKLGAAEAPVPASYYSTDAWAYLVHGEPPPRWAPHVLRNRVSYFNSFVAAGCVALFFLLVLELAGDARAAFWSALLFAFGSLLFPYAGTFFSEPLAILALLGSLLALVRSARSGSPAPGLAGAGLLLGFAVAAHVSAILFTPFWLLIAACEDRGAPEASGRAFRRALAFIAGLAPALALLGYYNYARFGSCLETGRTADPEMVYAVFVPPWRGLWGLLFGAGKGLLLYCPAALLGLWAWRELHRARPLLSWALGLAVLFRLVFVASRSDWHGGFCLGPRLLLQALPLLLLPVGYWLKEAFARPRARRTFAATLFLCVAQQLYFCQGEVFSLLLRLKWAGEALGRDVFAGDMLYLSWETSPLRHLWRGRQGPWFAQGAGLGFWPAWAVSALAAAILLAVLWRLKGPNPASAGAGQASEESPSRKGP